MRENAGKVKMSSIAAAAAVCLIGAAALAKFAGVVTLSPASTVSLQASHPNQLQSGAAPKAPFVSCLGSVEPDAGVVVVAAPTVAGMMPIVARLFVREGDPIRRGQVLAELNSVADFRSAARQAEARVLIAQRRLEQWKAGPRAADVRAIQAQIERLETELAAAQSEADRKAALAKRDLVPRIHVEEALLRATRTRHLLEEARQRQSGLHETRHADLALAEAELGAARADLDRALGSVSDASIRAHVDGRVIRILARPGEAVGPAGLLVIAPGGPMVVVAEIYETDASRVRIGQKARITAGSIPRPLTGTVAWISPQIEASGSPPLDPAMFSETRIYKARITVDQHELLTDRIHARVNVLIQP